MDIKSVFRKKLLEFVPVLGKFTNVATNNVAAHYVYLSNKTCEFKHGFTVPYLADVDTFLDIGSSDYGKCITLISKDINVARKVAAYISENNSQAAYYCECSRYEETDEFIFECDDNDSQCSKMREIKLFIPPEANIMGVNPYIMLLDKTKTQESVFFTGLSGNDTEDKLDVIDACPSYLKFIVIEPDEVDQPWFQRLLIDLNCDLLYLDKLSDEYYYGLIHELFNAVGAKEPEETLIKELIRSIKRKRGKDFIEEDIAWYLDFTMTDAVSQHNDINLNSLLMKFSNKVSVEKKLAEVTGLASVKAILHECMALSFEELLNPKLKRSHNNMIFYGNPGTGKTMCARIVSDIMSETGTGNGAIVTAARNDIIGKYVGHTAGMIKNLFNRARGGVLFIDEAGFIVNECTDVYVSEAIKEFVRYMELYPDVTVIFAMYTNEVEAFLSLDAGLSSRIGRILLFPDYSDEELINIAQGMFTNKGYSIESDSVILIKEYICWLRKRTQCRFGNAREMRKLVEACIIVVSLRHYEQMRLGNVLEFKEERLKTEEIKILREDIQKGIERLKTCCVKRQVAGFGFSDRINLRMEAGNIPELRPRVKYETY